jgi:DNA-directed RNA polymerase subunit RPC12/RpoP
MSDFTPLKRCSQCGAEFPPTLEYFARDKRATDGLRSACKTCQSKARQQYKHQHPDRVKASRDGWKQRNPEKVEAHRQLYRERHPDREQARHYRYRQLNADKRKTYKRQHRDNERLYILRWKQKNPAKVKALHARYEARKRSLPATFTEVDWQRALDYWHGCCAICGRPASNDRQIVADHWIPLNHPDCPGTVPTNILPMCHSIKSGALGCNSRKYGKLPDTWLVQEFGVQVANEILAKVAAYFRALEL